jgi:spore cortex formation protein SpoVR/YcgB (stage V sporulation)
MNNILGFNFEIDYTKLGLMVVAFVVIVVAVWYSIYRLRRVYRRWLFGREGAQIKKSWTEVEALLARNEDMASKLAIMQADTVLDQALKLRHFPGETMALRLKSAERKYRKLNNVWWAHKLRNTLSHELGYSLRRGEARRAVASFKAALIGLGAL